MSSKGKLSERLTMKGQIHKAYKVLLKLKNPKYVKNDQTIPLHIIRNAKGIAFLTVIKGGFVFSGTLGSGIIIAKKPDGTWSGPSSLGVAGMGWGALIGASSTDSVIILNTDSAVKAFTGKGQVKFGGNLSVALGPVGRESEVAASVGDKGVAPCYSYSHSRGLFGGLSLQGAILAARDSDNKKFYQMPCTPGQILSGHIEPPENEDLRLLTQLLEDIQNNVIDDDDNDVPSAIDNSMQYAQLDGGNENAQKALGPVASTEYDFNGGPVTASVLKDALPGGWQEYKDPTGKPYYYNEKTNVTQWERPVNGFAEQMAAKLNISSTSDAAGSGYAQATSVASAYSSASSSGIGIQQARPVVSRVVEASAPPDVPQRTSTAQAANIPAIPPRSYKGTR